MLPLQRQAWPGRVPSQPGRCAAPWHLHNATAPIWAWVTAVGHLQASPGPGWPGNKRPGVWGDGGWGVSPQHGLRTGPGGRTDSRGACGLLLPSPSNVPGLRLAGEAQLGPGGGDAARPPTGGQGRAAGGWLRLGESRGLHSPARVQRCLAGGARREPLGSAWPCAGVGWGAEAGVRAASWLGRPWGASASSTPHRMPGPGPSGGGRGVGVCVCGEGLWGRKEPLSGEQGHLTGPCAQPMQATEPRSLHGGDSGAAPAEQGGPSCPGGVKVGSLAGSTGPGKQARLGLGLLRVRKVGS